MASPWEVVEEKKIGGWDIVSQTPVGGVDVPPGGSMPISAITGNPVNTAAEDIQQTKGAIRNAGPIVGDVVGTIAGQAAANAIMPGAGALPLLGRLAMQVGGAGVGGGLGEFVSQKAFGEPTDMGNVGAQAALSAGGEAVFGPLGLLMKKAEKPALELAADLTISGSKTKQWMSGNIKKKITQRADKFVEDIAPEAVKGKIDDAGINQAVTEAFDANTALYHHFKSVLDDVAAKNQGFIPLTKTSEAMEAWLKEELPKYKTQAQAEKALVMQLGFSPSGLRGRQHVVVRKLLNGEEVTPQEANFLLANMYEKDPKKYLEMDPTTQQLREALKETIVSDLDSLGAGTLKRSADEMFKEMKQFQRIKSIYDSAMQTDPKTLERVFAPMRFIENLNRSERVIRTTMPEMWPKLKAEAEFYQGAAERIAAGNRSLGVGMFGGLASSAFTGYIPVGEAFGAASAWALMSPTGQKALEGVFKYAVKPAAKAGLHIGGELVDFNDMVKSH